MKRKERPDRGVEVALDGRCPCGSGLLYRNCHYKTDAKYYRDSDGAFMSVPLPRDVAKRLRDNNEEFIRVFGRPPGEGDLLFFNRIELGGDHQFFTEVGRVAETVGIDQKLVFAARRTQRFVAEMNLRFLSATEKREWNDAIAEYDRAKARGFNPFYRFTFLGPRQFEAYLRAVELIREVAYVLDGSIHFAVNTGRQIVRESADTFVISTMANTATSLVSVSRILNGHFSDDVVGISRGIFEDYLRIKCLRNGTISDETLLCAQMASRGYLQFAKRANGKTDFDLVQTIEGKTINVALARSYAKLAKQTGDGRDEFLYDVLYQELSARVHRDVLRVMQSLGETGTLPVFDENDRVEAVYYIGFVTMLFLSEVVANSWLGARIVRDIGHKGEQLSVVLERVGDSKSLQRRLPVRLI